ncbi:MAG: hypothetical protein SXV54_19515 [Chloroflexota bacterium]|nr:hypothetical protein [Chloroflexota bacterium]
MTKKHSLSRREFIRLSIACGFGATAGGALLSLTGCGAEESSELAAQPSATTQPAATAMPTSEAVAPTEQPTTAAPTDEPATEAPTEAPVAANPALAIARGSSPTALVQTAIAALGGIGAFVKPGDDVIIKPNIVAADYSYEYAPTTSGLVYAAYSYE